MSLNNKHIGLESMNNLWGEVRVCLVVEASSVLRVCLPGDLDTASF